ncbi:MAG: GntR family transcriptional regulator, transcriptional repressor for pyruvate dehydrogenase complex [Baekduia sp.]|nr:GntR family transcriptional regulator, transcriptional repressor for pyruvate dehydrogenase complex [Baekduia sp.]
MRSLDGDRIVMSSPKPEHPDGPGGADGAPAVFAPIEMRRTSDAVVTVVVDAFREGRFAPGDQLPPERDLAEVLNVSRKTVREALDLLRRHGVVTVRRGSGGGTVVDALGGVSAALAEVQPEDPANLRGLLEVRRTLETAAAVLLVERVTDDDAAELRGLTARFAELMSRPTEFAEADLRFHLRLATLSGNAVCADLLSQVLARIWVIREQLPHAAVPQLDAVRSQQALVAAIERRKPAQLLAALDGALAGLEQVLIGRRLPSAAPSTA